MAILLLENEIKLLRKENNEYKALGFDGFKSLLNIQNRKLFFESSRIQQWKNKNHFQKIISSVELNLNKFGRIIFFNINSIT